MKKQFSIVIAEDHTILREGLKSLLSSHPDLNVVGEAADGLEAIRSAQKHSPDLVLMDLSMPKMTGFSAIKEIKRANAQTKILAVTAHSTEEYILATFKAGADGYLLKDAHSDELLTAVRHVLEGRQFISPSISGTIIDKYLQGKESSGSESAWETLTQRERVVVKLIAEGYTNKEIADLLNIAFRTVATHRAHIMQKLGIHNVAGLTALAVEKGLINR
jgi:two-component system response regulator NreC